MLLPLHKSSNLRHHFFLIEVELFGLSDGIIRLHPVGRRKINGHPGGSAVSRITVRPDVLSLPLGHDSIDRINLIVLQVSHSGDGSGIVGDAMLCCGTLLESLDFFGLSQVDGDFDPRLCHVMKRVFVRSAR